MSKTNGGSKDTMSLINLEIDSKKRLRFVAQDDVILLREVLALNPFEDASRWVALKEIVHEKSRKNFTIRALKEHLDLLLKKFTEKDDKNIITTGIEEDYNEYDHLLQQIKIMMHDFKGKISKPNHQNKLKDSITNGKILRETYLRLFNDSTNPEVQCVVEIHEPPDEHQDFSNASGNILTKITSPKGQEDRIIDKVFIEEQKKIFNKDDNRKPSNNKDNVLTPKRLRTPKRLKNSALEFLTSRNEKENILKTRELELEARKLDLEEKRIKLEEMKLNEEIDLRKKALELEAIRLKCEQSDKKKLYEIVDNYHKLLELILNKKL